MCGTKKVTRIVSNDDFEQTYSMSLLLGPVEHALLDKHIKLSNRSYGGNQYAMLETYMVQTVNETVTVIIT